MKKAKLVIFRHGETEFNKQHRMTGQINVPLTELGVEQAKEAGLQIGRFKFKKVYSSHLNRSFNTAALALDAAKTQTHLLNADGTWQIEQRREIAEMDFGRFAGRCHQTDAEILAWKRTYDIPFPYGESEKQVVERVQKFFDEEVTPRLKKGENVLIVAHAGVLRAFDIALGIESEPTAKGLTEKKKRIPNATPTVYEFEDGVLTGFIFLENPKAVEPANGTAPSKQGKKPEPKV